MIALKAVSRIHIAAAAALAFAISAMAQVDSIGVAGDGEFTRITVASQSDFTPDVFMQETENGLRIELAAPGYQLLEDAYLGEPTGGVAAYTLEADRIVFELSQPMMISREIDLPPSGSEGRYRFMLDLSQVSAARFSQAARRDASRREDYNRSALAGPEPVPVVEAKPETPSVKPAIIQGILKAAAQQRRMIVIDPGHGGRDPGALVVSGGEEADIVLETSLLLKALLEKDPRFDVRLTRETDIYVEHEDRVTKARNWGADLFISVHADAALKPSIFGASVYTISSRGEKRIEGTAEKYGWNLPQEGDTSEVVSDILQDLTVRETKSNSTIFAEYLVPELAQAGPLLRNTHRQENLFVLLAPDVPAVLVEIGFVTNKADAKRLKSKRGRQKSAEAIKRAIDAYFDRQDMLSATN